MNGLMGNFGCGANYGKAHVWDAKNTLPRMQQRSEKQSRPMPKCYVQIGRDSVALLALRLQGGEVL